MTAGKATRLVVVESPAKAKTISRFLDERYQVEASYGHVRDLPQNAKEIPAAVRGKEWARLGVDVEHEYRPVYVVPADKKKHVKRLKEALKGAERLLLATDEDREGESISWHVLNLLEPPGSLPVERIVFHEVTREAINQALEHPRAVDEKLVRAQEARRILDRLYGYTLSPLLWKRVAPGLSAGRVQSVAVRLTVQRERERMAFRTAEYWDLAADLAAAGGRFAARLVRVGERRLAEARSFDPATGGLADAARLHLRQGDAGRLAEAARQARPWKVTSLARTPGSQRPAPPFTTSTLQQEANRKLRFTAQRTMRTAQQLYEGVDLGGDRVGLITYMRTDSVALASRAVEQARRVIDAAYGAEYLPERPPRYRTKAKRAQEAHEAIRPTDLSRRPQDVARFLDPDQARLYELIWKRTVACQMVPARFERTAVEVTVEAPGDDGAQALVFAASGRRIDFPGFLRAYVEGSDDPEAELGDQETLLPALDEGQELDPVEVSPERHETRPPMRYTEASLVKRLEEEGIGRPSTYAAILSTIQERGYISKRGNELVPSFTAFCVTQLLEGFFPDLVDTEFTARMEDELDEVAAGEREWIDLVRSFYRGDGEEPGLLERLEDLEVRYPSVEIGRVPETGELLHVKIGRYGPYLSRGEGGKGNTVSLPDDFPPDELSVERALALLNGKTAEGGPLAHDPATGKPITLQMGRYGPYLELGGGEGDGGPEAAKPKRVSLPKGMQPEEVTAEIAAKLMSLPRPLGRHPESGEEVSTGLGRYGPYLKHGGEYRNLGSWEEAVDLTFEGALAILAQPKPQGRGRRWGAKPETLKELGEVAGAAGPVRVLSGRYGPYVTDGEVNASLPRGADPQAVTAESAADLLARKRAAGPGKGRRRRSRRSS